MMRLGPFCVHKLSLKLFLACTFTSVTTLYLFWSGCEVHSTLPTNKYEEIRGVPLTAIDCSKVIAGTSKDEDNPTERTELSAQKLAESDAAVCPNDHRIDVIVNGGKKLEGRLIENEAYVPFSFVKDYFDIYGDLQELDGKTVLDWRHSYSDIHHPKAGVVYETKYPFLWFEHYHVEGRSRVKCISGVEDVPVSLQWSPEGHFYPIQIAQYGLSHYNLLHIEGDSEGKEKVFEDAETVSEVNWSWAFPKSAQITNVFDKERNSRVLQFSTTGLTGEGISLSVDSATKDFVLNFDLLLRGEVRVSIVLELDNADLFTVHYTSNNAFLSSNGKEVFYGVGHWKGWRRIARNLDTDLRKGIKFPDKKNARKGKMTLTEVQSILLHGKGLIDNITLMRSAHEHSFLAAANWFLRYQNNLGSWPITVKRKVIDGVTLLPDWYSAMGQGQGMSLLTRAYLFTKNPAYLRAALRATKLFKVKAVDKGVLNTFMNQYHWYEEYPTSPSTLVLNGFIYSLLGLYDLKLTAGPQQGAEAAELFDQGMRSLKAMLPLYDSGSGSFYDLRHMTMRVAPNLARWDYHTLHVSLLYVLANIDPDPILKTTAMRWEGYTQGKRAKHN